VRTLEALDFDGEPKDFDGEPGAVLCEVRLRSSWILRSACLPGVWTGLLPKHCFLPAFVEVFSSEEEMREIKYLF
jgi:hypothetical protein